jgi:hypothetical protein
LPGRSSLEGQERERNWTLVHHGRASGVSRSARAHCCARLEVPEPEHGLADLAEFAAELREAAGASLAADEAACRREEATCRVFERAAFVDVALYDGRLQPPDLCDFSMVVRCLGPATELSPEAVHDVVANARSTPERLHPEWHQRFERGSGLFLIDAGARTTVIGRLASR